MTCLLYLQHLQLHAEGLEKPYYPRNHYPVLGINQLEIEFSLKYRKSYHRGQVLPEQ